jgi:hypothetical protein
MSIVPRTEWTRPGALLIFVTMQGTAGCFTRPGQDF